MQWGLCQQMSSTTGSKMDECQQRANDFQGLPQPRAMSSLSKRKALLNKIIVARYENLLNCWTLAPFQSIRFYEKIWS